MIRIALGNCWISSVGLTLVACSSGFAGPVFDRVVSGELSGPVNQAGGTTTINQQSQNVAIDWSSFNINNGETVNFVQPDPSAIALNRDFSGSPSQIFGNLNANGHVFLINSAGVVIGNTANIDVGSLLVSDLWVTDADAANFGSLSNAGTLPFSDQELSRGGIQILGTISTREANGMTMLGQYIYIGGSTESTGGDTNMMIGGSAVLVTDPNGLYGVELEDPVRQLAAGTPITASTNKSTLYSTDQTPGQASVSTINGDINISVKYSTSLDVTPIGSNLVGHQTVGLGNNIFRTTIAVTQATAPDIEEQNEIDSLVNDSLFDAPEQPPSQLIGDAPDQSDNNISNLMQDCAPTDVNRKDCFKQQALKHYLGRLLIGGSLPD